MFRYHFKGLVQHLESGLYELPVNSKHICSADAGQHGSYKESVGMEARLHNITCMFVPGYFTHGSVKSKVWVSA